MNLTSEQVRAQATAIRKRSVGGSRVMALQHVGTWRGPDRLEVAGEEHRVLPCVSDLQIREALGELEAHDQAGILLCSLDPTGLGDDVLARLAKRRIHHPQMDEMIRELFSARLIDARVLACKPLVDALIRGACAGPYLPPPGGVLDLNAAWRALLKNLFQKEVPEITFPELLHWTTQPGMRSALMGMDRSLRDELARWLSHSNGDAPRFLFQVLETELGTDTVAVGLLFGLLLSAEQQGVTDARAAEARLEHYFGNEALSVGTRQAWFQAAAGLLRTLQDTEIFQAKEILQNLDRLIDRVRFQPHAKLSDYSTTGLEQRLTDVGDAIIRAVQSGSETDLSASRSAMERASQHFLATSEGVRLRRLQMAIRLLAWRRTASEPAPAATLSQLANIYYAEGGFVEWARNLVSESDPNPRVKDALHVTLENVDAQWRLFGNSFCQRLKQWATQDGELNDAIRIEDVLHGLVAPAAKQQPALMIVLDGMSMAAFRELLADLLRRNWAEVCPPSRDGARPVLATIPSITEVSRRSLLSGRLPVPTEGNEKSDFARNQRLFEEVGGAVKPQLFLKGDLMENGRLGLSTSVSEAISNTRCRLVGVVVNAIDDTLGSADQTSYAWTLDQITPLYELLRLASEANRLVILTSDHGHVLDGGSQKVSQPHEDTGDRYRQTGGTLQEGEMELSGPRIRAATQRDSIVALAAPRLRYQAKRRGYHGGISPAEMIVPGVLLRNASMELPEGWNDLPPYEPSWWSSRTTATQPAALPLPTVTVQARRQRPGDDQGELFQAAQAVAVEGADWISRLLSSEAYQEQARQAVRGAPPVDQLKRFLVLLEQRNGRVLRGHLAQQLEMPLLRMDGLIQNYRRLLNVDGYDVLSYEQSSETISLNIPLLKNQFDL